MAYETDKEILTGMEIEKSTYMVERNMPRMHYHRHYEILYVYNNTRMLTVGGNTFTLDKNTVAIIPPYIPHLTVSGGVLPQERLLINFREAYVHDIRKILRPDILDCVRNPCSIINIKPFYEEFSHITKQILKSGSESDRLLLLCRLLLLLSENNPADKGREDANEIIRFTEANFNEKITLDLLAEKFYLSKFTVSRYFSRYTGMSLPAYINSIRIVNAQKYLRDGMRVTETAFRCGFESTSNFDRVFLKIVGMSPREYKKFCNKD